MHAISGQETVEQLLTQQVGTWLVLAAQLIGGHKSSPMARLGNLYLFVGDLNSNQRSRTILHTIKYFFDIGRECHFGVNIKIKILAVLNWKLPPELHISPSLLGSRQTEIATLAPLKCVL